MQNVLDCLVAMEDMAKQLHQKDREGKGILLEQVTKLERVKAELNYQQQQSQQAFKTDDKHHEGRPKHRYSVNLYRDVTHIKWVEPKHEEIRGYICKTTGDAKKFRFDTKSDSQHFITNSLWTMCDSL